MSAIVPIDELREQLAAARAGFDGWAKAQIESLGTLQAHHLTVMRKADEEAKELRAQQDLHIGAAEELQKVLAKQREELDALSQESASLRAEEDKWPAMLANLAEEVEHLEAQNESDKTELADTEAVKREKAEALAVFKEKYRRFLGLTFEHPAKDRFKLVLVNIDPQDHGREFSFILHVSDKYSVVECNPEVQDVDKLLVEVNKTNDFSMFVRTIRRLFQETCKM